MNPLEALVRAIAAPLFDELFKAYRASQAITKEKPDDLSKAATADMDADIDRVLVERSRAGTARSIGGPPAIPGSGDIRPGSQ